MAVGEHDPRAHAWFIWDVLSILGGAALAIGACFYVIRRTAREQCVWQTAGALMGAFVGVATHARLCDYLIRLGWTCLDCGVIGKYRANGEYFEGPARYVRRPWDFDIYGFYSLDTSYVVLGLGLCVTFVAVGVVVAYWSCRWLSVFRQTT